MMFPRLTLRTWWPDHLVEDTQGYTMNLRFLCDANGREVDFVVLRDERSIGKTFAKIRRVSRMACAGLLIPCALSADQVRFDTAREWQSWRVPTGAVKITPDGRLRPVESRKQIKATLNAADFGGGIRAAGSNLPDASLVLDGDLQSGWGPDPADPSEDWWLEVDLGRGVSARRVILIFDESAPPMDLFEVFLSDGEPEFDQVGAPIPGSLVYRTRERFKSNDRREVHFALERARSQLVQFLRFEVLHYVPQARLVEVQVEAVGDNMALRLLERGGALELILNLSDPNAITIVSNTRLVVDGNLASGLRQSRYQRGPSDINSRITLDLGATFWVDQTRLVGIQEIGGSYTFDFQFYEFMTSDGSLSPDGTLIWNKHFSGTFPYSERANIPFVDHHFTLSPVRYLRVFWRYWDSVCGREFVFSDPWLCNTRGRVSEIQVFGEGYPRELPLVSPILDLGGLKNVSAVRWEANTPPGTRVEIRSRAGNHLKAQITYHDKNGKVVTERKYNKLIPSFKGPVDTVFTVGEGWSPWSRLYRPGGESFLSPSLRRYVELDMRLVSDTPRAAATMDWLELDFSSPLANIAAGEIYPVEVQPGEWIDFTYYLKSQETRASGFDRVEMETSTEVRFREAYLNGELVEVEAEATPAGFRAVFPNPIHSDDLVELRFAAAVFLQGTRFDLFLGDGNLSTRQLVDPGDATDAVESSTNVVNLPVNRDLLANLVIGPTVLTPNGDGTNDQLEIALDLVNVLENRPLQLRVFDLSGRLMREIDREAMAGSQGFVWDGRDGGGRLVVPGIYLLRIELEGDERSETVGRTVSVVY